MIVFYILNIIIFKNNFNSHSYNGQKQIMRKNGKPTDTHR